MRDVERRSGLVEQEVRRLLLSACASTTSCFSPPESSENRPLGEVGDPETRQRLVGVAAGRRVLAEAVAPIDRLAHGEVEVEVEVLRHKRDLTRHVAAAVPARRHAFDEHLRPPAGGYRR